MMYMELCLNTIDEKGNLIKEERAEFPSPCFSFQEYNSTIYHSIDVFYIDDRKAQLKKYEIIKMCKMLVSETGVTISAREFIHVNNSIQDETIKNALQKVVDVAARQ